MMMCEKGTGEKKEEGLLTSRELLFGASDLCNTKAFLRNQNDLSGNLKTVLHILNKCAEKHN